MMLVETDFLIVRHDPAIGSLIRKVLIKNRNLIVPATGQRRQWQDGNKVCRTIVPNWPDTDDEGEKTNFRYSLDAMVTELKARGASVEAREKVA